MKRKKVFDFVIALCVLCASVMILQGILGAAGTVTETVTSLGTGHTGMKKIVFHWIGSSGPAGTGEVTAVTSTEKVNGFVSFVVVDPRTTAPTNDYDITITDQYGADIMGGELANMSSTTSGQYLPKIDGDYGERYVDGTITLNVSNNTNAGAAGIIAVYIRGKY